MLVDAKEKFLLRSFENGSSTAALELYNNYKTDAGKFDDAAYLYQKILVTYKPCEAMSILLDGGVDLRGPADIENEFINAMCSVAKYHHSCENYFAAVHWAKKGMDMAEKFSCNYSEAEKRNIMQSGIYRSLEWQFLKTKKYFDPSYYKAVIFEWEESYF